MIRRVYIPVFGDESVLEVRSGPSDPLVAGTARLRVEAAGVNFADLVMRMGLYPEAPPRPFVPGYEVAGTLLDVAPDVVDVRPELVPGRPVLALTRFGGYADEVVTPAAKVFPLPDGWTARQGAAFPVTFLTAWTALVEMARVRSGDRVLIHGVAGGVGSAAAQIARAAGARIAGTCGGSAKVEAARTLGVEFPIDHRTRDVAAAVHEWAPDGVDVILESRGGKHLRLGFKHLGPAGRIVSYGVSAMAGGRKRNPFQVAAGVLPMLWLNPLRLIRDNAGFFGVNVLQLWDRDDLLRKAMTYLLDGIGRHGFAPVLDEAFPLERAADAHRRLHDRKNIGKVVLTTGS